jgi:hypothetical protein
MDTLKLQRGQILRTWRGNTITARSGTVWITEQDSRRDVVLRQGQRFTLERPGLALVEAVSDAAISLEYQS